MNISKHKIVLLGEAGVGKTSIVSRFIKNHYSDITESTIGGSYYTKCIDLNGTQMILNIWDTAGQERYRSLTSFFNRGAAGCLCVFDVTDRKSFLKLSTWIKLFRESNESQKYVIVIVGNKFDISENKWQITRKEVEQFAINNNCEYKFTSCYSGDNINDAFYLLANNINNLGINNSGINKNTIFIKNDDISYISKNGCWC